MPKKEPNPPIGKIKCSEKGCSQVCSIHQARRGKGRFLYTRGAVECGCCEQSASALRQTRIWNEGDFDNRDELEPPPNLLEYKPEPEKGPEKEPESNELKVSMPGVLVALGLLGATVWGFIKL